MSSKSLSLKFRKLSETLAKEIENKLRPFGQGVTRKRLGEYNSRLCDGRKLERLQDKLLALADGWDNDTLPTSLRPITSKVQVEDILLGIAFSQHGSLFKNDITVYNAAMREFAALGDPAKNGKLTQADELNLKILEVMLYKIDGFFPTPPALINRLLEIAAIKPGERVLEPSAGAGHIADTIRTRHPDIALDVIERNGDLYNILNLKGYSVIGRDFLECQGKYDVIIQNPPFERFQDIDHVKHAWTLLNPGGRLVSIMSLAVEFRTDKKAVEFRQWLADHGGTMERLPQGSFMESEKPTPVSTIMIAMCKDAVGQEVVINPVQVIAQPPAQPTHVMKPMRSLEQINADVKRIAAESKEQFDALFPEAAESALEGQEIVAPEHHDQAEPAYYLKWIGINRNYHPEWVPVTILKKRPARCYIRLIDGHEQWADRGGLISGYTNESEARTKAAEFERSVFRNKFPDYSTHSAVAYYQLAAHLSKRVPYVNLLEQPKPPAIEHGFKAGDKIITSTRITAKEIDPTCDLDIVLARIGELGNVESIDDSHIKVRFPKMGVQMDIPHALAVAKLALNKEIVKPLASSDPVRQLNNNALTIGQIVRFKGSPGWYRIGVIDKKQITLHYAAPDSIGTVITKIEDIEPCDQPSHLLPTRQREFLIALYDGKPVVRNAATRHALRGHGLITLDDWERLALTDTGRAWVNAYYDRQPAPAAPEPNVTDVTVSVRTAYLDRLWMKATLIYRGRWIVKITATKDGDWAQLLFAGGGAKGVEWDEQLLLEGAMPEPVVTKQDDIQPLKQLALF